MRLVASAQGGNDVSLNNLNQNVAVPKFVSVQITLLIAAVLMNLLGIKKVDFIVS